MPEATHHAGTAKVTSAITATSASAAQRRVILSLTIMRTSKNEHGTSRVYPAGGSRRFVDSLRSRA